MLKKFSAGEDISTRSKVKSSVQRAIRSDILLQYPSLTPELAEFLLPKKEPFILIKCQNNLSLLSVNERVLFFKFFNGNWFPHLKLLHQYPFLLPVLSVDKGAIKFVLQGANVMCPGLTSAGALLPDENIDPERVVAIHAEGKQVALAVGLTKMSTQAMKMINKGVGLENIHFLGDGLFRAII